MPRNAPLRADILLLLTAAIWGFAFSAQRAGMDYMGPFTYNALRFLIGAASLAPLILIRRRRARPGSGSVSAAAALASGLCLFTAAGFQQTGIFWTTAGNSGFITGVYVVLVPIAGVFLKRKAGLTTWAGAVLTLAGLFFVSGGDLANLNKGDALTFVCGVFWTVHVLLIDNLVKKNDAVKLACGQFAVCGLLSLIPAALNLPALIGMGTPPEVFTPGFSPRFLTGALVPLLYGGVCSVGVAYTLQVVAQQWAHPAHASIILCMESVFAVAGGMLLLGEKPAPLAFAGFALMLSGMMASQAGAFFKRRLK